MKKIIVTVALMASFGSHTKACGWYDPDYEYFSLFSQTIIKDKAYIPFLRVVYSPFYYDNRFHIHDENIEAWQKYFGNTFNYEQTEKLVNTISLADLNSLKLGQPTHPELAKLGSGFYPKYKEGIDYLIEAKYLEPYMIIKFAASPNSFYDSGSSDTQNATHLDYNKTIAALESLYSAAKNPEIKLRYGYQLVRFNHYTRNFEKAIEAFNTRVAPLKLQSAPYYLALDQYAGALRGLNKMEDANWNFFKVFSNSKIRKESAFTSMKLSDSTSFKTLLSRANTPEEKNMAYFLLAYDGYNNPIPQMEKMYEIDPNSEILKVLASRSINELERSYLPLQYNSAENNTISKNSTATTQKEEKKLSFWDKIVGFFKRLFGIKDKNESARSNNQSDENLVENPSRIPFYNTSKYVDKENPENDFAADLEDFASKTKAKSNDEFWKIAEAYLKFLRKDYDGAKEILADVKTNNPEYLEQINRLKVLTEITAQPKIDAAFEEKIMKDYKEYFVTKEKKTDTASVEDDFEFNKPNTEEFLKDVLANRYFLQGEDGKSFLMNNQLSDVQYSPNPELVKKIETFYKKPNKTSFEQEIITKNMDDVGNIDAFFNTIYGDFEMRAGKFDNAKKFYEKAIGFQGIPRSYYGYDANNNEIKTPPTGVYNGFNNLSKLIFGHNVWESYWSDENESMKQESFIDEFPFIKDTMSKLDLANALIELQKTGKGKDDKASKANQLIGNLLYNTSILGYYREVFVMDYDNSNGGKYDFAPQESPFNLYYKYYSQQSYIKPDNFDVPISYYKKALESSKDRERNARILFQMASAEQGKYYQWENKQPEIDYNTDNWEAEREKRLENLNANKNKAYRIYFTQLKNQYSDTQMSKELMGSCSYFGYFMRR